MAPTYTQKELDDAVSKAKVEVYREFVYKDYGTPDIRICPECGKPDVHWSVSSSLNCRDCKSDHWLRRTQARVRQLETIMNESGITLPEPVEFWGDKLKSTPPNERIILIVSGGDDVGTLVEIYADGHVVFGENYTPEATAKIFWECMATYSPAQAEYHEAKEKAEELRRLLLEDRANREKAIQLLGEIATGKF